VTVRQPRRPNGAESKNLNIRVPADVLEDAKKRAAANEETLSSVVVRFLREYGKG
jgi:predicted HicB family RNase H-like nuclease